MRAFHLGHHCPLKYSFMGFSIQRVNYHRNSKVLSDGVLLDSDGPTLKIQVQIRSDRSWA